MSFTTAGSVCDHLVEKGFIMTSLLSEMMARTEEPDLQLCALKIFLLTGTCVLVVVTFVSLWIFFLTGPYVDHLFKIQFLKMCCFFAC